MVDTEPINTRFTADTSGFLRGVEQAKAKMGELKTRAREASNDIDRSFKKASDSADRFKASWVGAALVAGTALSAMAVDMAKFASKAEGVDSYFERSFGVFSEEAWGWAEELSEAYGVYSGEVEQYSAKLNEGFKRAGNGASQAFQMAKDFTQLAYDISAVRKDMDVATIQDLLQDLAVGGGEEALEKLLPGFDEEALKAEAYRSKIAQVGEELTVQAKQLAAYNLLMQEYGDDMGKYGEESLSASKALNNLDASARELKEALGTVLSPAVTAVANGLTALADRATAKINEVIENGKRAWTWIQKGVNGLAGLLGQDPVFDLDADEAVADTSALDAMLNHVTQSADEARASLVGLLGFDQLNILKFDKAEEVSDIFNEGEEALLQWVKLFETEPERAVDYLDEMWDDILDGSYDSVEDLKRQYGQYFDWMLETELANEELTQAERQALMDQFYQDLYDRVVEFKEDERVINEEFDRLINEARLAGDEETVAELEKSRDALLENTRQASQLCMDDITKDILTEMEILDPELAKVMEDTFAKKADEIKKNYTKLTTDLKLELEKLNELIAQAEKRLDEIKNDVSNLPTKVRPSSTSENVLAEVKSWFTGESNDFFENQAYINAQKELKKIPHHANGTVYEPNDPTLAIVGDNTREREVIAPESMIEESVIRALQKVGGNATNRPIEIHMTVELDGRQVARGIYKYTQQDSLRRGNPM